MHYTISKKEIRQAVHVLKACLHHPDADDAIAMLQGLLDQPEGEPVAYRLPDPDVNKKHHYFDLNEVEHVKHVLEALYTHPAPFTQLQAEVEALRKNAERYLKLRRMAVELSLSHQVISQFVTNQGELDAVITKDTQEEA